jgi:hypothetical protein
MRKAHQQRGGVIYDIAWRIWGFLWELNQQKHQKYEIEREER